jgi:hypothetical protein
VAAEAGDTVAALPAMNGAELAARMVGNVWSLAFVLVAAVAAAASVAVSRRTVNMAEACESCKKRVQPSAS